MPTQFRVSAAKPAFGYNPGMRITVYRKADDMMLIVRIIGLSLLTGGLAAVLGNIMFKQYGDPIIPAVCLACVGAIIGAVAGAAREIVAGQAHNNRSNLD